MTITLLNGQTIDSSNVRLESDDIHFTQISTGTDITRQMKFVDKRLWPDFDSEKSNALLYSTVPGPILDDSTADAFFNQLETDPLGAPLAAFNSAVSQIFDASGTKTILWVGGGLLVLILLIRSNK